MAGNDKVANRMRAAADLMRKRGLTVGAFANWATAGRSSDFTPRAVTCHHTAAAIDVDRLLRDGRADLPGPLCNWALHRDGSWWLVASGRANHAGVGWLPSSASYGIEATGPVPVTATGMGAFPNYEQYVTGVACILEAEGWEPGVVYAHKETASPDGRKIDPAFGDSFPKPYRDMDRFRGQVNAQIGQPIQEDDDMTVDELDAYFRSSKGQATIGAIVREQVKGIYPALARGEINGAINEGSQHYDDSHRGLHRHLGEVYEALARGEINNVIDPTSQHYQDSHRALYRLAVEILSRLPEPVEPPPPPEPTP